MLAEKVETQDQFLAAQEAGFVYFQGYFFRRPEVMKTREIPSNRVNYLRMLEAVSRPDMDIREVEGLIKQEASVLYRLLRYLNSHGVLDKIPARSAHQDSTDGRRRPAATDL
jgi:EAL and modified HD-GYP domain-containing signal transduction protein